MQNKERIEKNGGIMPEGNEKKKTKIFAWSATVLYLLLAPLFAFVAYLSAFLSDSPNIPHGLILLVVFLYLLVLLSIPVTLYLVWSRYLRNNFRASRRHCFDTLYVLVLAVAASALVSLLF